MNINVFWRALAGVTAALIVGSSSFGKEFRAAVVKVDITPSTPQMLRGYAPRMSTSVHDRIFHRIVALDDGVTSFYLISSDLCSVSPAFCDRVTGDLARTLGVPGQNVWWSITHNHSSPYVGPPGIPGLLPGLASRFQFAVDEAYTAMVEKTLVDGVHEARRKLTPAKLAPGWGYAEANINRRARDVDGRTVLGMNPAGAVDRRIGLLRLDKPNGEPLALIANYAMHATVLGARSTVVSADFPGAVYEHVEQALGAPMLYINGAAGNIAPIYSGAEVRHLSQFKLLLGERILQANRNIHATKSDVVLRTESIMVTTAKRPDLKWSEELKNYLQVTPSGAEQLQIPIRLLRINDDIAIWSAPMELFCEISNEIRDRSPFPYTFYFGYTNGTFAYMPTEAEYVAGGYEPSTSPFTASAGKDLIRAVSQMLQEAADARAKVVNGRAL
jgi:neutral ceramidase